MSLFILPTGREVAVVNHLASICSHPNFNIDQSTGEITYSQAPQISHLGCELFMALIDTDAWIGVRGETPDWSPGGGLPSLAQSGGAVFWDVYPAPEEIHVVYDATNCNGAGRWVEGPGGSQIQFPPGVLLFHELGHAYNLITGLFNTPIDPNVDEDAAIQLENLFRAFLGSCLPQTGQGCRSAHGGGCNPDPPPGRPPQTGTGTTTGIECFVATAAYGSPMEPEVQFLRSFRDDILRQTRAGADFFERFYRHYYRISPLITDAMRRDKKVEEMVRWAIVSPLVQYLQLLVHFPDAPIEKVEEPWRSFLLTLRNDLENWTGEIPIPEDFHGLTAREAAREIEVIMRFVLLRPETRAAYLDRLAEKGQLPLHVTPGQGQEIARALRASGRSSEEIKRILGEDFRES